MIALLGLVTAVLLGLRLYAATKVGFGDSEALYATWAAHPQPAYLDHPGLVAVVSRAIGEGASPTPFRTHVVTAVAASLLPWLLFAAARALGAPKERAAGAAIVFAVVPEIAVGLFALTPDLLLAPLWIGSLALAGVGLLAEPGGLRSSASLLGAGLLAGVACAAKAPGVLLYLSLVVTYALLAFGARRERAAARTVWPWAGLAAGAVVVSPIVLFERARGWPMLAHRLVDTQPNAGVSLRNVLALAGGQIAYVSPVLVFVAIVVARHLVKRRDEDAVSLVLVVATFVPLAPLVVFAVWSPVAEPHWIAPALLALPLHAARRSPHLGRRVVVAGAVTAGVLTLAAHAYVLVPDSSRLVPESAGAKADIARELYGWPAALDAVKEQMKTAATPVDPEGREVVVVGPHWTICAQLAAGLPGVRVGCATPVRDDFDDFLPRDRWRDADDVLWVTDDRFDDDGAAQLPAHVREAQSRVRVLRGGRARVFELYLYGRRASTELREPASPVRADLTPASRRSERSSSGPGFGVVSSLSP